jgi:hypothetical protein
VEDRGLVVELDFADVALIFHSGDYTSVPDECCDEGRLRSFCRIRPGIYVGFGCRE